MRCAILLLALGMAAASQIPARHKLPIYGFAEQYAPWSDIRNVLGESPLYHLLLDNMFGAHISPLNIEALRAGSQWGMASSPENNLREISNKAIVVLTKANPEGKEGVVVHFLERGLSSLAENPSTRAIHEQLKAGAEKIALILHAPSLNSNPALKRLREQPVTRVEIPEGMKLNNMIRATSNRHVPYVAIQDKEEFDALDIDGILRLGSLEVTEKSLINNN
ncbi:uncharacterized protein [Periplaneta americana]|uniref:uncharacterized protein n=1 Tax=Periplaneta americana TaxID=6978 RepID=UPI0037E83261